MEGWIKLHRKFLDWEWYRDGNTMRVFLHLLLTANHKTKHWKGIEIKRGQVIIGRVKLAQILGLTQDQIRTAIIHLKSTNEITTLITKKYSLITICKFEEYQAVLEHKSPDTSPDTSPQNPHENPHEIPTTKKDKKEKKKENPSLSPQESFEYLPEGLLTPKFKLIWTKWWKYRKSENWTTKVSYAELSCTKLMKLSGGNVSLAIKIVEQSMEQGWQGLFALKQNGKTSAKRTNSYRGDSLNFDKPTKNLQDAQDQSHKI
jgi:hypothetical protein